MEKKKEEKLKTAIDTLKLYYSKHKEVRRLNHMGQAPEREGSAHLEGDSEAVDEECVLDEIVQAVLEQARARAGAGASEARGTPRPEAGDGPDVEGEPGLAGPAGL